MQNKIAQLYQKNVIDIKIISLLAFPVIVESILQVLLGTADAYFVSKIDSYAISGIGLTTLMMNIVIAFFTAVGVGTTAVVSRYYGMKNYDKAAESIKQAVILSVLLSILIGVISYLFSKQIFRFLGATDVMLEYALPYFNAVAVPAVFLGLILALSSASRGIGDTTSPMIAVGIASILNIILDYFFIFGFWKFEGMGILGAGIATTLSRFIACIILFISFSKKKTINKKLFSNWKIDSKLIKILTKIGIPSGLEKLFMRFGQLVYNSVIISLGTASYVAHNIAGTIESYTYLPALGFGVAAATLVGKNLGMELPKRARRLGILSNILSICMMVVMGLIIFLLAEKFVSIFTNDPEIIHLAVTVLRIMAMSQLFLSTSIVISSALQGAGDTKFPMYLTLAGIWVFRVGFGYLLAVTLKMGLPGIWLSMVIDIAIRSIILYKRFLGEKWKNVKID
jgi:MATE family, multidrug efflux pump